MKSKDTWPVVAGSYQVGDRKGPVAVCALTSERLVTPLVGIPGVAIAGMVYTANLGITRIIMNLTTNPAIRFLLICGKDSALFKPGQSLLALSENGVDNELRVIGAEGYDPVLPTIKQDQVFQFRRQIQVLDRIGEDNVQTLEENIKSLVARNPGPWDLGKQSTIERVAEEKFDVIRPGGQREPLLYDPKGYFVITIEPEQEEIVLRHYEPDHTSAHEMRGRGATSMLLGLLRDGLVTQLSHAGYLGEELAKAQTALQFGLRYDQDRPLRPRESTANVTPDMAQMRSEKIEIVSLSQTTPKTQKITIPMTWKQVETTAPSGIVDFVFTVTDLTQSGLLNGIFLEADEAEPFTAFRRTEHRIRVQRTQTSRFAMGTANDLTVGALVRANGRLIENNLVQGEQLVILTKHARILS